MIKWENCAKWHVLLFLSSRSLMVWKYAWYYAICSSPVLLFLTYLLPKKEEKKRLLENTQIKSLYAIIFQGLNAGPLLKTLAMSLSSPTELEWSHYTPLLTTFGFILLQNAGVQFPQSAQAVQSNHASSQPSRVGSVPNREQASPRQEVVVPQAETVPESRWLLFLSFSVLVIDMIFRNPFLSYCI